MVERGGNQHVIEQPGGQNSSSRPRQIRIAVNYPSLRRAALKYNEHSREHQQEAHRCSSWRIKHKYTHHMIARNGAEGKLYFVRKGLMTEREMEKDLKQRQAIDLASAAASRPPQERDNRRSCPQ
jgi:hypothetical protein